ncbi:MAG: TSCPD domain-containing protein, partial [bacterium]|nr:TSCPD domain-containing protein [bacterium]
TIAPTGSISIIAGASSGIEPLFALGFLRKISIGEFLEIHPLFEEMAKQQKFYSKALMEEVVKKGSLKDIKHVPEEIKEIFITAMDITPEWHIKTQAAFQKYTHNAVSKTINLPSTATVEDIKNIFLLSYRLNCKGLTVYRDKSRELQVLNVGQKEEKEKDRGTLQPRHRPMYTKGVTIRVSTGCGNMYVTINEDQEGLCEVFAQLGKAGGCPSSQTQAIARLISLSLRSGVDVKSIIKELRGIRCPNPFRMKEGIILSCPDAVAVAVETYLNDLKENAEAQKDKKVAALKINSMDIDKFMQSSAELKKDSNGFSKVQSENPIICPECGSTMIYAEGCSLCSVCGYSKCS